MEEDFNFNQVFIEWCLAQGFTSQTPGMEVLQAMVDNAKGRIEAAEARGEKVMKTLDIDGSILLETIEQAKEKVREFKQVFGLK